MKMKFFAIFAAAVIILSFAACGKTAADTTTSAASTIQSTGTTAAENTTDAVTAQSQTDARTGANTTANTTVPKTTTQATTTAPAVKTFTKADLAKFDGINGSKGYIAYEGIVYDVTEISPWKSGDHQGLKVGTDLTAQVNSCTNHHTIDFMKAQFSTYPQVGTNSG